MLKEIAVKMYSFVKQRGTNKADFVKMFSAVWSCIFICGALAIMCFGVPAVWICAAMVLSVNVKSYFTDVYSGKAHHEFFEYDSIHIRRPLIVMLMTKLKTWIWLLIPFIGIVLSIIKSYEYRFVPYIFAENDKLPAKEVMTRSSHATVGFKKTMFILDIVLFGVGVVPGGVLFVLSKLPFAGVIFGITAVLYAVLYSVFLPFIREMLFSVFYVEVSTNNIQPAAKTVYCPFCMSKMDSNCMFCSNCGEKLVKAEGK